MAQQYDITFKSLFRRSRGVLSRLLFGEVIDWPNIELPEVRNLRIDLLARCADGALRQVELQVNNDARMPFRMLEYAVAIHRSLGEPVEQTVLYVGRGPLTMPTSFRSGGIRHEYTILNLREMDGAALLASDDWTDNEWALLTRSHPEEVIRVVFAKLQGLRGEEQREAATSFMIIGGILGIETEIERRFHEEMIDIMDNQVLGPAIRRGLEQGLQQGMQQGISHALQTVLESRFGTLPSWVQEKITTASPETKNRWLQTFHQATSLEDALR